MRTRIFLSWCHQDRALKEALLRDLLPALGVFTDLDVEWWEDSHLTCGEELTAGIVDRLDEADYGLLLLSTRYFGRPFIQQHELPRFAGVQAAAWDRAGTIDLALSDDNTGDHRAEVAMAGRRSVTVPAVRLDDAIPVGERVDVIKLDTQGTEHIVLGGARRILARCAPVLVAEFWPAALRERGDDPLAVLGGYTSLGYSLDLLEDPSVRGASEADVLAATERIQSPETTGPFGSLVMRPAA